MTLLFRQLQQYIHEAHLNKPQGSRKAKHTIEDMISKGTAVIYKEAARKRGEPGRTIEGEPEMEMGEEAEAAQPLSAEDLSTEGMI